MPRCSCTETITWHHVAEQLPDADLTVHVATEGCEEPVWLGFLDGETWRDVDGMEITVTHWAEMLKGPSRLCGWCRLQREGDGPAKDCPEGWRCAHLTPEQSKAMHDAGKEDREESAGHLHGEDMKEDQRG